MVGRLDVAPRPQCWFQPSEPSGLTSVLIKATLSDDARGFEAFPVGGGTGDTASLRARLSDDGYLRVDVEIRDGSDATTAAACSTPFSFLSTRVPPPPSTGVGK